MSEKYQELSNKLIQEYWSNFKKGKTWNFFGWKEKYSPSDNWSSDKEWLEAAKECVDLESNLIQAYEILLCLEFDKYVSQAEIFVSNWSMSGGHDAYYFYDILSRLPKSNLIRKEYLSEDNFDYFLTDEQEAGIARKALVNVGDERFILALSEHLGSLFSKGSVDDETIEEQVIPLLLDLGHYAKETVSPSYLSAVKEFCLSSYEKDKNILKMTINGDSIEHLERQVWVGDDLAYWSWKFGWDDVLNSLLKDELYWTAMFSELWEDADNNNLLIWTLNYKNAELSNRSIQVMEHHDYCKVDGAIAWSRLNKIL